MSSNKVDKITGELVTLANGSRMWVGTKAAHDAAVQAGTMPNNCIVAITDDYEDATVDVVEDGNMHPVTSNAVYDVNDVLTNEVRGNWASGGVNKWQNDNVSGTTYVTVNLDNPLPSGTYTLSANVTSSDTDKTVCRIADADGTNTLALISRSTGGTRVSATFTISAELSGIILYASETYYYSQDDTFSFTDIQIEEGSTATPYQPYAKTNQQLTNDFNGLNETLRFPLNKIVNADLNNVITEGLYYCMGNLTNSPSGSSYGSLFVQHTGSSNYRQIYIPVTANDIYTRYYTNNAWSAWNTPNITSGYFQTSVTANVVKTISSSSDITGGTLPTYPSRCTFTSSGGSANSFHMDVHVDNGVIKLYSDYAQNVTVRWIQFNF